MSIELEHPLNARESAPIELAPGVIASTAPESNPGPQVAARLIEYAPGRHIALPPHTTYALLEQPEVVAVPGAAHYAYGLLTWQDTRLPLLDINALVNANPGEGLPAAPRYALIVAYQGVPRGPIAYGAIGLDTFPQTIAVGDDAQCDLPADGPRWPLFALSCFRHEGQAVPILDSARLFAAHHG